jgi:hypothetical protein
MKRRAPIHVGPRTWALVREDYLRGDTGPTVCKRYGVRLDALRARASREGWGKWKHALAVEIDRFGPPPETQPKGSPAAQEWGE